jgi:mannose-6-phosphate isomerase-like protein (cupin superfamily)
MNAAGNSDSCDHELRTAFSSLEQIDIRRVAMAVQDRYRNFVLAKVNDHCVRMAIMRGEYPWHCHRDSDEFFFVLEGCLEIDVEGHPTVSLGPGEAYLIPAAVVHRTRARDRCVNLCFEHLRAYADATFTDRSA